MMNKWAQRSLAVSMLVATLAASGAVFADDMILKLDGIKGESARQPDGIDITGFSWGASQAKPAAGAGGGAAGRPSVERFVVTKQVDASSPQLIESLLTGRTIASLTFAVRRSGDRAQPVVQIDLKNVRVVDLQMTGGESGRPTESVSFTFTSLTYQYFPLDRGGRPQPAVKASWDAKGAR